MNRSNNRQFASYPVDRDRTDEHGIMQAFGRAYMIVGNGNNEFLLQAGSPWRLKYAAFLSGLPSPIAKSLASVFRPGVSVIASGQSLSSADMSHAAFTDLNRRQESNISRAIKQTGFLGLKAGAGAALAALALPVIELSVAAANPIYGAVAVGLAAVEAVLITGVINNSEAKSLGDKPWLNGYFNDYFDHAAITGSTGPSRGLREHKSPGAAETMAPNGPGLSADLESDWPAMHGPSVFQSPSPKPMPN